MKGAPALVSAPADTRELHQTARHVTKKNAEEKPHRLPPGLKQILPPHHPRTVRRGLRICAARKAGATEQPQAGQEEEDSEKHGH